MLTFLTRSGHMKPLHLAAGALAAASSLPCITPLRQRLQDTAVQGRCHTLSPFLQRLPRLLDGPKSRWDVTRPLGRHEAAGTLNLCVSSSRITNFASKPSLDAPKSLFEISIT
ncbi:hypothetical protein DY000_02021078 [Brassica cretica]|uniref:Secreted protein n=1 Tax=Brassica cretica TaxID=69181 RepID=A0ABQ7EI73_BRACR|nr:hypothetical protein DY000_02021078 [Brassica cretica]